MLTTSGKVGTSSPPPAPCIGISSPGYIFLMGLLMSQWTIMGYDAAIHVAEVRMKLFPGWLGIPANDKGGVGQLAKTEPASI